MGFSFTGKGSWFGGPRDGMDSGKMAGGNTTALPAVAVRLPGRSWRDSRKYLNHYVRVTAPNGKTAVYRIGDLGPNESTGRNVDITYSGLKRLGYTEGNFPTDAQFKVEYVGKSPGARTQTRSGPVKQTGAVTGGSDLQAQARRQAAAQWLLSSSKSVADLQNRVAQAEASVPATAQQQTVTRRGKPTVRPSDGSTRFTAPSAGYPLAKRGQMIGTPHSGTHTLGNWQSDNAVDVGTPNGTPVLAPGHGVVEKVRGGYAGGSSRFDGFQVTVRLADGQRIFYTHLSKVAVKPGQRVRANQTIGRSGSANGVPHLHMGVERGDPRRYLGR